jgi:hypothetical protein
MTMRTETAPASDAAWICWGWPLGTALAMGAFCALAPRAALWLGPLVALGLGALAVWTAPSDGRATIGRDAAVGARVGIGVLIGVVVGYALAGYAFGGQPAVQELVRSSEPHPEARVPAVWIPVLSAGLGALGGLGLGLTELALSALGAWLYGLAAGHGRPDRRRIVA